MCVPRPHGRAVHPALYRTCDCLPNQYACTTCLALRLCMQPRTSGQCRTDSANTGRSLVTRGGACHRALQQTHQATCRHKTPRALESAARKQAQRGCKRYQPVVAITTPQRRSCMSSPGRSNTIRSSCAKQRENRSAAAFNGDVLRRTRVAVDADAGTSLRACARHRTAGRNEKTAQSLQSIAPLVTVNRMGGTPAASAPLQRRRQRSAAASRSYRPGCRHAGHRATHGPDPASHAALSAWSAASAWARCSAARFPPARGGPDGCRRPGPPAR